MCSNLGWCFTNELIFSLGELICAAEPISCLKSSPLLPQRQQRVAEAIRCLILTPQCSTQDLRVEPLLIFADLWCVALRASVNRINVNHRSLSRRVGPQRLRQPGVVAVALEVKAKGLVRLWWGITQLGPRDSNSPRLLRALPVDGETWRRRGSMKGVKEEEDLCFCMLLLDWL